MNNLILIGMPGSGKTTFGRRLAAQRGLEFVDTDEIIEQAFGLSLQNIVDQQGLVFMKDFEEKTICAIEKQKCVIATGGSVVYSVPAMQHLSQLGCVIYLQISYQSLEQRVSQAMERGLFKEPSATLKDLYLERLDLYEQWADITLNNDKPLTAQRFKELSERISG